MKLSSTVLLSVLALAGCGGDTTTGNDGGSDASNDATTNNDASGDATTNDAPTDSPIDAHGKLDAGDSCDLQADNCGPGLKCCSGGAVQIDAGTGHCVVPTDAGTCALVP